MNHPDYSPPETEILNEAQKRYLTASLVTFEKLLHQVLSLLHDKARNEIFYQTENDISDKTSALLEQQIYIILNKFMEIKERYHLQPVIEKSSRLLTSQLSLCWAGLLDVRPKVLSGYGNLDPAIANELEIEINNLTQTISALINLVNQSNSTSSNQT